MSAKADSPAVDTRERILDAAEALFIEYGFAATSLRAIATLAEVNLAATNYHFGSKMGLLAAVFHRSIAPINEMRLDQLNSLEGSGRKLTMREILEALFLPLARSLPRKNLLPVIGRIYSEPESITKPLMENEFAEVSARFQSALSKVVPGISQSELRWRFHLMVGSMIHLMKFQSPLGLDPSPAQLKTGIEQLIEYSIAGLSTIGTKQDV